MVLMAIDLGTSSAKSVLYDPDNGDVLAAGSGKYSLLYPRKGFVEQNPKDWWAGIVQSIRECLNNYKGSAADIAAIGLSGQMVGVLPLDAAGQPLYNCIIHLDMRCDEEITILKQDAELKQAGMNEVSFINSAPKLFWLLRHEKKIWADTHTWLLPKDYIRFKLTGMLGTDISDASDTLFMDMRNNEWHPIIEKYGLDINKFPQIHPSHEVVGAVTGAAAEETGLREGIPVVAGAADMACTALGTRAITEGIASVTIGTTGHIKIPIKSARVENIGIVQQYAHAIPGLYYAFGAIPAGGLSLQWLKNVLAAYAPQAKDGEVYMDMNNAAGEVPLGAQGVFFLPYLGGSLMPYLDSAASGGFIGLRASHSKGVMTRAVMEGIAYHFRQLIELFRSVGIPADTVYLGEGGCQNTTWPDILANVFNTPTYVMKNKDSAPLGAAIIAGVGVGVYKDWYQAVERLTSVNEIATNYEKAARYDQAYAVYLKLYPALQGIYNDINGLEA